MPYLSLSLDKHDKNCPDPFNVKRLYIRDYDNKDIQTFVPYALTCLSCDKIVKVKFEHRLTKREKRLERWHSNYSKEQIERAKEYALNRKVKRRIRKLERKLLGEERISPEENGLRRRIKGYNNLYSGYECSDKVKELINWDMNQCQRFLDVRPTVIELCRVIYSSPLHRYNNGSDLRKFRGYIPDPDKEGWFKYDKSQLIPDPNRPGKMKWNDDKNFVSEYEKLIIKEAELRKKLMNDIIESHSKKLESKEIKEIIVTQKEILKKKRNPAPK